MIHGILIGPATLYFDDSRKMQVVVGNAGPNYEPHIRDAIKELAPKAKVFWDVGSNIGIHTINAKLANPELKIVSFEPVPCNYSLLARNVITNNWTADITIVPIALGATASIVWIDPTDDNPRLKLNSEFDFDYRTPVLPLDAFDLPLPQFIKIDVEGAELDVLKGASKLMRTRPIIISEYNISFLEPRNQHLEYPDYLIKQGYKIICMDYRPGMRKEVGSAQELYDHLKKWEVQVADFIAFPK